MKKLLTIALICALFAGCSEKNTDSSSQTAESSIPSAETTVSATKEEVMYDDIDYESDDDAVFCVFNCNNAYMGTDKWCYFLNGYTPETEIKDGEFLEVNADVSFASGGVAGSTKDPQINELKNETPIDCDTAIEKYGIPFIGDTASQPSDISYYKNNSGTYIICYNFENGLRFYLNGEYIGNTPYDSPAQYKRIANNPELCEIIKNGDIIPESGFGISYISFEGNEFDIDVEHLHSAILDGLTDMQNYNDLPSEPFTAEFEKKCKDNGLYAKLYIIEGMDFEMYGNEYDVDYFVVCSESPDGQAYISINGEDMKEFSSDAAESIKSLMH